jgi:hypothetical protein
MVFFSANSMFAAGEKNKISNYKIEFFREKEGSANVLHVRCEFDINLNQNDTDTVELKFGGQLGEDSVPDSNLTISSYPAVDYTYDYEQKKLTFRMKGEKHAHITMEYDFLSFSSAFIYREICEIWETSFSEYYYPFIFGEKALFDVTVTAPDNYYIVGSYPFSLEQHAGGMKTYHYKTTNPVVSHACIFAILPDSRYRRITTDNDQTINDIYLIDSIDVPAARMKELADMTTASVDFFSKHLSPYSNEYLGIENKITYIFHTNGFSNRNNVNFISVSQDKFAQKPHILPLVHEIGHRWFGEWTLLIGDGEFGAYFIKESLNEYLSFLFAKNYYGQDFFDGLIDSCQSAYGKIKGSDKDRSLYDMKYNNNNTIVYNKGSLIINEAVKKMGEEQWLLFMKDFYSKYAGKPDLKYENFIELLKQADETSAILLDDLIKGKINI